MMSAKSTLVASLILSVLLTCSVWTTQLAGEKAPSSTALAAFEAIHSAEESGLQNSAPDAAFDVITNQAIAAQKSALSAESLDNLLTRLLVPVIAFILSFITTGSLRFRKRLAKERILDSEIRTTR